MPLATIVGEIRAQPLNDNFAFLESNKISMTELDKTVTEVYVERFPIIAPETDDGPRIQRAIDQAIADGGGKVKFAQKIYTYSTTPTFNASKIILEGEPGTEFKPQGCHGLEFGDITGTVRQNYVYLRLIRFIMTDAAGFKGIISHRTDEIGMDKVVVGGGEIGIDLDYSYNVTLQDVVSVSQTVASLRADIADKLVVIRGQFGNGEKGIVIKGGKGITFIGSSIERNNDVAVELAGSTTRGGEYPDGVNFLSCYFERNATVSGNGFIHVGVYDSTIGDYCKGINFVGNYFNWDTANPRSPSVPFFHFDRCSDVSVMGSRYSNSSNYSDRTSQTKLNKVIAINDAMSSGRGLLRTSLNQIWIPFDINVTTDGTGFGSFTYDATSLELTNIKATGTMNTNISSSSYLKFEFTSATSFKIIVTGATASSTVNVTGIIMGTQ
jgi:hypothetical protein